jgi:hypothetical protein
MTGWLAKNGLDLALAGMSLMGDDEGGGQKRQSFRGQGASDPVQSMNYIIQALQRLGAGLESRPNRQLSQTPAPVYGPGGVKIGGSSSALMPPVEANFDWMKAFQPFQGAAQGHFAGAGQPVPGGAGPTPGANPGARRRTP